MRTDCLYGLIRIDMDGTTQMLGCYPNEEEAQKAHEYYSEVRYPNSIVDIIPPGEE